MTDGLVLAELLEKAGDVAEAALQLLMEIDVEVLIGAGQYQRSDERTSSHVRLSK
jgi:hypothetical protein